MRTIADQTVDELGGAWSILHRQRRDHARMEELLEELLVSTGDDQRRVLREVNRLVFPHAFAEESVVWPALRRVLPRAEGEALTLEVEQEHQEVNQLVVRLEHDDVHHDLGDAERRRLVERLVEVLRADARDEEDRLLPRLQEEVGVGRLRALGLAWEAVRRTAPTRPHPVVARRPPGNVLAAVPLTVLDRARDALDARATAMAEPVAAPLRRASQSLAAAAGRVERLGVLRLGEDPSTRPGDPRA